jgi:hypothetical protein
VSPALLQRLAALAAGALLATLGVLALRDRDAPAPTLPPVQASVQWERAVVGVLPARPRETACGVSLESRTIGVAHPLLPCGADLVVSREGKEIRTEVVERAPVKAGRDFELTQALARELGVSGETAIRWRFAD